MIFHTIRNCSLKERILTLPPLFGMALVIRLISVIYMLGKIPGCQCWHVKRCLLQAPKSWRSKNSPVIASCNQLYWHLKLHEKNLNNLYANNTGADQTVQLLGLILSFIDCCLYSTMAALPASTISGFLLAYVAEQAVLSCTYDDFSGDVVHFEMAARSLISIFPIYQ